MNGLKDGPAGRQIDGLIEYYCGLVYRLMVKFSDVSEKYTAFNWSVTERFTPQTNPEILL
jgi:hypothetical protein